MGAPHLPPAVACPTFVGLTKCNQQSILDYNRLLFGGVDFTSWVTGGLGDMNFVCRTFHLIQICRAKCDRPIYHRYDQLLATASVGAGKQPFVYAINSVHVKGETATPTAGSAHLATGNGEVNAKTANNPRGYVSSCVYFIIRDASMAHTVRYLRFLRQQPWCTRKRGMLMRVMFRERERPDMPRDQG